jgi:hypothetical protein
MKKSAPAYERIYPGRDRASDFDRKRCVAGIQPGGLRISNVEY